MNLMRIFQIRKSLVTLQIRNVTSVLTGSLDALIIKNNGKDIDLWLNQTDKEQ